MTSNRSFTGDLLESFRWITDVTVVEAEGGVLDLPDFYFTDDDYRYRFEPEAKERFLDLPRERFNSGVKYKGRAFKWDTRSHIGGLSIRQWFPAWRAGSSARKISIEWTTTFYDSSRKL